MGDHNSFISWLTNITGGSVIAATLLGLLPSAAAGIAFIWYAINIYESQTVQRWIAARRMRKLARLKARVILMEAQMRGAVPLPPGMEP